MQVLIIYPLNHEAFNWVGLSISLRESGDLLDLTRLKDVIRFPGEGGGASTGKIDQWDYG